MIHLTNLINTDMMKKMITLMMVMLTCVCMEAQQHNNNGRQQQGGRREFNPELYMKKMNEFVAHEAGSRKRQVLPAA